MRVFPDRKLIPVQYLLQSQIDCLRRLLSIESNCLISGYELRRLSMKVGPCTIAALALSLLAIALASNRSSGQKLAVIALPSPAATQPSEYAGLHNVVTYAEGLYSGSVPQGAEGFATLAAMGIRTIISVDGATPDVELAKQFGLRYVHLPVGYDGITKQRSLELARAVRDLPGPIYIHCHHGQHRSAAAAAAAGVTLGKFSVDEALALMKVSGTAPNYTGLFACVRAASVASPETLETVSNKFPEKSQIGDLAQVMTHVDETMDNLKLIEKANWTTPKDHPDLVPAAEAARLADFFRNAPQPKEPARTDEFAAWISAQASNASEVEQALLRGNASPQQVSEKLKIVSQACVQCHSKYRD